MSDNALELIRREGVFGLGGYDGCLCTHFFVRDVHVGISCRKSSGNLVDPDFNGTTVRIYSQSGGLRGADLREIAEEIAKQLREKGDGGAIAVRYCSYEHDKELKCTYCHKLRATAADYLCPECKTGLNPFGQLIAEVSDPSRFDIRFPEPNF